MSACHRLTDLCHKQKIEIFIDVTSICYGVSVKTENKLHLHKNAGEIEQMLSVAINKGHVKQNFHLPLPQKPSHFFPKNPNRT